jgi:two-component sensor histidine kinase/sugar lactone lactonase YvrE
MPFFKPSLLAGTHRLEFTRWFILFFCFLAAPLYVSCQNFTPDPDWRFENFNSQNHFINRDLNNIAIDKNGYVWTSSSGIQRFDGYKTIDFNSFNEVNGGLKSNTTDLIADKNGRIWVISGGLCYYDDAAGKFIYVQPDPKRPLNGADFMTIKDNCLWFIGEYGLEKLDLQSLKITYTSLLHVANPLGNFFVDDHTILVSSREKVYFYDIKTDTYSTKTFIHNQSLIKIFSVATSGATVFLGTNHGLYILKDTKDFSPTGSVTPDIIVDDLLFMPRDKVKQYLFLATEGSGILVYNTIKNKVEFTYAHDDNNPFSLASNVISSFRVDSAGRLWAASGSGISMLDINNQQLKMRFFGKSNISNIVRDKYDSTKVWMSSFSLGMICINWETKQVEKVYNTDPRMRIIYDCKQIAKNKWLLATSKKILEWDSRRGIVSEKEMPVPDSLRLSCDISKLIVVNDNTCFAATNMGLFKYDLIAKKVTPEVVYNKAEKAEDPLQYILLNGFYDNGVLWMASRNGLLSYNTTTHDTRTYRGKGTNSDYFFFDINKASNNRIISASAAGITIFNKDTKSFRVINSFANLTKPVCVSVFSRANRVWIGTEMGLINYDLDSNKAERVEQGDPLTQIPPSSPFTRINDNIVIGYPAGYAYFTSGPKETLAPSDPIIQSVSINNLPVLQQFSALKDSRKMTFGHSDNSINIAFTAFLYPNPDNVSFRYRLTGAHARGHNAGDERSANFAQLEPGDYTFDVQSGNNNGAWNKHLASFNFVINPPYWGTWWFRTLVTIAIAIVLYRLYRYRIDHLLAIERIRERIASDFHDDIGAALSSISIFSEVADTQLEEELPHVQTREIIGHISSQSHAMLDAMDDIIWAVNPQNDHFTDLAVRMREFAIPLLEAKNIEFDIKIPEEILNTRIKMEARKNIFLIFKECINNILKHSGCSAMTVSVSKLNNQLELVISDNGVGFDIDAKNSRNGLKNMQKRASEINGTMFVKTRKGNGTVSRLLVNTI